MITKSTVTSTDGGMGSDAVWHNGGVPQFGSAASQTSGIAAFDEWDFTDAGSQHADGVVRARHQEHVWFRHRRTEESVRHY